ncbi:MAG: hypothetical protein ACPF9K_07350 [Neptuniibacter sp.]
MLEKLHSELKSVVEREVKSGNSVSSISDSWPQAGKVNVLLVKRFVSNHHETKRLLFVKDNDPHHKMEMYLDKETGDCVYCSAL